MISFGRGADALPSRHRPASRSGTSPTLGSSSIVDVSDEHDDLLSRLKQLKALRLDLTRKLITRCYLLV